MITITDYHSSHQKSFEELNKAWITQYFQLDPVDIDVLTHPSETIVDKGGHILIAINKENEEVVGTAALLKVNDTCYELTKMTVKQTYRGKGIGNQLMKAIIEKAIDLNATTLELYTQKFLPEAISLYQKFGFVELKPERYKYSRADTYMIKQLPQ